MDWFFRNFDYIAGLVGQHLVLSVIPVVASFVVALPIGFVASRNAKARGVLLSMGGVLYSIPSLPLFVILPAIIGTGILNPINVIIALSLYGAALMIRACSDAFLAVSPTVLDAASATGYSPAQRFFRVELPLAGPVLLAGLRVISVSTVSLVSVGAIVGVSSLGSLFTDGFQRGFATEIWIGMILIIVLALVMDGLLVLIARLLMPWTRVATESSGSAS